MKSKGVVITLIVFLSILAVALVGGMILLMNKDFNFSFNVGESNLKLIDTFETNVDGVEELKFELESTDVEVKEASDGIVKIEYYSNKNKKLKMEQEGSTVLVEENEESNVCIGICINERKVVVYVPASYKGIYNIKTASGDIKYRIDIVDNKLTVNTSSGDVALENAGDVYIKTVSGEVKTKNIGKNKIITTSGDIAVKAASGPSEIKTTSGDIAVTKVSKGIDFQTVSGYISVSALTINENSSIKTTSGDVRIGKNTSTCYVDASTTSGDINIDKSDRKSDLILTIKTVSGDITVR